jgi:D-alanyl-D-alanine carboxypeptidase/D-alanyl-D-alanine-endopeptidase (penicillin-binding protein 4)
LLFAHNADLPLVPASTLKVATAAVALEVFGPDHRFTTQVRTSVPPTPPADDGAGAEVDGDVYLVGGGDPLLATQGYAVSRFGGNERVVSGFEAVADAIAETGVRRITGDVVGDGSRHDGATGVDTWDPSYLEGNTIGALGALRVNSGLTGWDTDPALPGMRGGPGNPALEAARIMVTLLADRGVTVDGGASTGEAPPGAPLLTEVTSPPMRTIAEEVLAWSNNGASELVVKELGLAVQGEASTAVGTGVVLDQLGAWGLPTGEVTMVDGSGLDTSNRFTCRALGSLLDHLGAGSVAGESLAVGASRGTLRLRLVETPGGERVRAKTGTLNPVVALAGFTNALPDDTEYTFAVVLNGVPGDPALSPVVTDLVAVVLTGHEATVDTSAFGPVTGTPDP